MYHYLRSKLIIFIIVISVTQHCFANDDFSVGECENLDSYIYYCKEFSCSQRLEVSGSVIEQGFAVLGEKDGKCIYERLGQVFYKKSVIPFKVLVHCELSQEGKVESVKEFQSYKKGNIGVYTKTNPNPILLKECKARPESAPQSQQKK